MSRDDPGSSRWGDLHAMHSLSCSVGEFALPTSALAMVWHNGKVEWVPQLTMTSHCNMNPALYPFDSHTCWFTFRSGVYNSFELDVDFSQLNGSPKVSALAHSALTDAKVKPVT